MSGEYSADFPVEVRDADGVFIHDCDDVLLLRDVVPTGQGNCSVMPKLVPAGTRATALMVLDPEQRLLDLECYLGDTFAFAAETGDYLRLVQRAADKTGSVA